MINDNDLPNECLQELTFRDTVTGAYPTVLLIQRLSSVGWRGKEQSLCLMILNRIWHIGSFHAAITACLAVCWCSHRRGYIPPNKIAIHPNPGLDQLEQQAHMNQSGSQCQCAFLWASICRRSWYRNKTLTQQLPWAPVSMTSYTMT